eukprot:TRINITY_DN51441_c0_g1_i1.p1 TRINITY_DN51441_c0_g1~~TRINITY_DN51441_c0_g1_i1.p1  ORF type:complete len:197 (-),score=40.32 TRINITY_DN51441_c0_g1_i1:105-695(-)
MSLAMAAGDDSAKAAVAPGQALGETEDLLAGRGTYSESGRVYASVSGRKRHADGSMVEVVPVEELANLVVPEVGATVIARVVRMAQDRADCIIVAVGDSPLSEKFRGIIRKQDVRFFEVDKVQMVECFRIGDFVRAQVLALGDARSYVLSTAVSDSLGVILARSTAGATLSPISWQFMKCPLTGQKEKRKVAKPTS